MDAKRKAGRPAIGKRYLIVLDDESAAKAEAIGGGKNKRSAGIRYALRLADFLAARVPSVEQPYAITEHLAQVARARHGLGPAALDL